MWENQFFLWRSTKVEKYVLCEVLVTQHNVTAFCQDNLGKIPLSTILGGLSIVIK